MARYKIIDTSPRFLAVDLQQQLVAGTFEHALDWLVDHELNLTGFDARFRNDINGAPAYPPSVPLKIVLFAYSRGMASSRQIESACRENVTFIALAGGNKEGKRLYGQRFATVEPVFGNIRHNKHLNRFTLRGTKKVDTQWKLFCLVHNIEKLAHRQYAVQRQ